MSYHRKMSSDELNTLPLDCYHGKIEIISNVDRLSAAVDLLAKERVLGFDIESKPSYRRGEFFPPALVQIATPQIVFLIKVQKTGLTDALCSVLSSPNIVKTGVAIGDDVKDLRKMAEFEPGGFLDLSAISAHAGMNHHGLRGLAGILLGVRISKSAQRSNWEIDPLTDKQVRYAATDAWMSLQVYLKMEEMGLVAEYFDHLMQRDVVDE